MSSSFSRDSRIYMDYNATTPLAEEVLTGIKNSLSEDWGNPSSNNQFGAKAKVAIQHARNQVAEMLDCSPNEVIFTSGGTEANNMVIYSTLEYFDGFKDHSKSKVLEKPHIITTNVEHDSIILPIRHLEERMLITSTVAEVNEKGWINPDILLSKITDETCLITVMYANNETGVIMPIAEIGKQLALINAKREKMKLIKILFHTDAAQVIGKENISFQVAHVDFMTIVGHKFYGPRIGCLCSKGPLFPLLYGGGQENRFRPGTENTPMIVGLGIAAELVKKNLQIYREHMLTCRWKLETGLQQVFGSEVVINCEESPRLSNTSSISFRVTGLEGLSVLNQCKNLIASVGAACHSGSYSQIVVNSGVSAELAKSTIRLSVGRSTTLQEVERVIEDLLMAVKILKAASSS